MAKKTECCPDCGQPLNEPQQPMPQFGILKVWCATCEDSRPAPASDVRSDDCKADVGSAEALTNANLIAAAPPSLGRLATHFASYSR